MQVDQKQKEIVATAGLRFLIFTKARLHNQVLCSEVARQFEKSKCIQGDLGLHGSASEHDTGKVNEREDINVEAHRLYVLCGYLFAVNNLVAEIVDVSRSNVN